MSNRRARRLCLDALQAALDAVEPYRCVKSRLKVVGKRLVTGSVSLDLSGFRNILVLAVGKASQRMAAAALDVLDQFSIYGMAVAPRGQSPLKNLDGRIEVLLAGHPLPDRDGLRASRRVTEVVGSMKEDELLLCLISGGASALLPSPADGITLRDKTTITRRLIRGGASIHEINTVRRHLSNLKGGRLVELCPASSILSLMISDVPGNQLHDIGSGLTAKDPTTYRDAVLVLKHYKLWIRAALRIKEHLLKGVHGTIPETPKPRDSCIKRVHNVIIAENRTACDAVYHTLRKAGINSKILSTSVEMEASCMGRKLAATTVNLRKRQHRAPHSGAVIIGGETSVRVTGSGKGGRNQEVALSAAAGIAGSNGTVIVAMGTDGIDGNSDAAGAIIDGNTFLRAKKRKLDLDNFSERNDSYNFFKKLGDNLITGPTGTNVGDVYVAISLS